MFASRMEGPSDAAAGGMSMPQPPSSPAALSPYLNFDPRFLQGNDGPEYILMEGVDQNKGVSHYCYQVGVPVMAGAAAGCLEGTLAGVRRGYTSLSATTEQRALFLNTVRDTVKLRSQPLGGIATIYSLCQFIMSNVRDAQDDLNHVVCGTATGALYKSTAGLHKCARGAAAGLGLTLVALGAYRAWTEGDRFKDRLRGTFSR